MKQKNLNIKKTIKKKIEHRHSGVIQLEKKTNRKAIMKVELTNTMNERNKLRLFGDSKKVLEVDLIKSDARIVRGTYHKKVFVDYDVVICIPSHNRYEKVRRLISQFYQQPTKYSFKIILLNDGSDDVRYDDLLNEFHEILYEKNKKPNGKALHWYCYNQMWNNLRDIQCHVVLQIDDDFILSDNFLDTIIDLFFRVKEDNNRIMAIAPHLWSFKPICEYESWWKRKDFMDGIALLDVSVIENLKYALKPVDIKRVSKPGIPVGAWTQMYEGMRKMDGIVYRTENSLVYHDGNDDSKLHGDARKGSGVYIQKYIGVL